MRAVVAVLLFVTAAHAGLWGLFQEKQPAPDFRGILPSVSYAPFEGSAHPDVDNIPQIEKIRADLKKLSTITRAIRLYSSTGGVELVPPIAAEFGLKVTVGAWIDKNSDRNEREIDAAINLAKRNSNVNGIVVGNETIYRGEQKIEDLIELIKRVKKSVNVPVTTGEIWNIWRDNPELASSVDFIAAHVLPYWENFTDKQAVDQAVYLYELLREKFPGKRIVIAEFGWPSAGYNLRNDTICEDTDLGLTIQQQGWLTHYTNVRYGEGLLPDTYEAFKKQRHRWAYGGFQIVKKHWRRFMPGASRLTPDQRREFSLGWLNWLGAESLGVVVAILNLIWVPIVAFADIAIPDKILTLPIIASFVVSLVHFLALYRLRVHIKAGQMLGAMIAAMSVQWTVSRAVAQGLITEHLPFARTSKGGLSRMSIEFQAFWEAVIGVLLLVGATVLVVTNGAKQVREIYIFAGVLVLQSLPFLAAVAIALLENSRTNSFAFWRNSAVRTAELIGLRPVSLPRVGSPSQPVASEIRREAN